MEGTETNQGAGKEDNKSHPIPATERREPEKKGQSLCCGAVTEDLR